MEFVGLSAAGFIAWLHGGRNDRLGTENAQGT